MRKFIYSKYRGYKWDGEIMGLVAGIHEYRGRQTMYLSQRPAVLDKLVEIAKVQSTESSNAIEGIRTTNNRLKQLVAEKTIPKNRDEEEIAGYRHVLDIIHENYEDIPITSNYILQLHKELYRFSNKSLGGKYKNVQNQIVSIDANGHEQIVFTPLEPYETEPAIKMICEQYNEELAAEDVDPLVLIPIFIHDFLCIHPFSDGNGRMSRLLTTLLLYRSGYVVGRYVSLEKKVAETKQLYYQVLNDSQVGWREGTEDVTPFIKYLLQIIIAAYRDFEERIDIVDQKSTAVEQVHKAINMKIGKFTKSEIMELCPGLSRSAVEKSLRELVEKNVIVKRGVGRGTYYLRADSLM